LSSTSSAGTQGGHDPADRAWRGAAAADRAAPVLANAEGRRDLGRDVTVGGDAGELDDVHHALLRLPADRVRETGLAEPAGSHDRRDPGRAQQAGDGGDVVVPAEQRVGVMPDAAADHRRVGPQQFGVHVLQRGARAGAELVAQPLPVVGVPGEGRRGPRGRRLAPEQFGQDLLVPRAPQDQLAQRRRRLGRPPQAGQRQRAGAEQRPAGRNPRRAQRGQRVAVPGVPALRAAAQREPGLGMPERRQVVAGLRGLLALGRAEQDRGGIDLIVAQREAVSARRAHDDVGAEAGPGA
jgi:hypothetical protein